MAHPGFRLHLIGGARKHCVGEGSEVTSGNSGKAPCDQFAMFAWERVVRLSSPAFAFIVWLWFPASKANSPQQWWADKCVACNSSTFVAEIPQYVSYLSTFYYIPPGAPGFAEVDIWTWGPNQTKWKSYPHSPPPKTPTIQITIINLTKYIYISQLTNMLTVFKSYSIAYNCIF